MNPYDLRHPRDPSLYRPPTVPANELFRHMFPDLHRRGQILDGLKRLNDLERAERRRTALADLNKEIDWDGRNLRPDTVLAHLSKLAGRFIYVENAQRDAPLKIDPADAHLLPPGRYPLKTLLRALSGATGLQWEFDIINSIVFKSRPPQPFNGRDNIIPGKTDMEALRQLRPDAFRFLPKMSLEQQHRLLDLLIKEQTQKRAAEVPDNG